MNLRNGRVLRWILHTPDSQSLRDKITSMTNKMIKYLYESLAFSVYQNIKWINSCISSGNLWGLFVFGLNYVVGIFYLCVMPLSVLCLIFLRLLFCWWLLACLIKGEWFWAPHVLSTGVGLRYKGFAGLVLFYIYLWKHFLFSFDYRASFTYTKF